MKELKLAARLDSLSKVLAFTDEELEALECPMKVQFSIDVALEEMYVNVANYAYPDGNADGTGMVVIRLQYDESTHNFSITLIDQGFPFDPLQKNDPDISLSAEERDIGGLGIFMVKKSMDAVHYVYKDGCNQFTMTKKLF